MAHHLANSVILRSGRAGKFTQPAYTWLRGRVSKDAPQSAWFETREGALLIMTI
jgi:hypothetical protein